MWHTRTSILAGYLEICYHNILTSGGPTLKHLREIASLCPGLDTSPTCSHDVTIVITAIIIAVIFTILIIVNIFFAVLIIFSIQSLISILM